MLQVAALQRFEQVEERPSVAATPRSAPVAAAERSGPEPRSICRIWSRQQAACDRFDRSARFEPVQPYK